MKKLILLFVTMLACVAWAKEDISSLDASSLTHKKSYNSENSLNLYAKAQEDADESYKNFLLKGSSELVRKIALQQYDSSIINNKTLSFCIKVEQERSDLIGHCTLFMKSFWIDKNAVEEYQSVVHELPKELQQEDLILRNEIMVHTKKEENLHREFLKSDCIYAQEYAKKNQLLIEMMKEKIKNKKAKS